MYNYKNTLSMNEIKVEVKPYAGTRMFIIILATKIKREERARFLIVLIVPTMYHY